jgi:hypothetical protein
MPDKEPVCRAEDAHQVDGALLSAHDGEPVGEPPRMRLLDLSEVPFLLEAQLERNLQRAAGMAMPAGAITVCLVPAEPATPPF